MMNIFKVLFFLFICFTFISCKNMSDAKIEKQYYSSSLYEGESYFVGKDGAFNYQKKIEIAHEDSAIFPELMLSYNSNHGNGMIGIGWKLDGIGFITRDLTYPLNYDGNDHYIGPNGDRLVKSTGNVYTYENEDYPRFELSGGYGGNDDEPLEWVKTDSSGGKYYYGTGDNSLAKALDSNGDAKGIRLWALQRVEDTTGNYYTIEYRHDGGEIYPDEIVYKESSGLFSDRIIEFVYSNELDIPVVRSDAPVSYKYITKVVTKLRLHEILLKSSNPAIGTDLIKKYTIQYNSGVKKSKVVKIVETSSTGSINNSLDFQWNSGSIGFEDPVEWHGKNFMGISNRDHFVKRKSLHGVASDLIDMNGDGLPDRVGCELYGTGNGLIVAINNGSGFDTPTMWHPYGFVGGQDNHVKRVNNYNTEADIIDMNGDGLPDRVGSNWNTALVVAINNGSGFNNPVTWDTNSKFPKIVDSDGNTLYNLIDMNGDGRPDRVSYKLPDGTLCFAVAINNGSGFESPVEWHGKNFFGASDRDHFVKRKSIYGVASDLIDMNGDGLPDRVGCELYGTGNGLTVAINNGSGFNNPTKWHTTNFVGYQDNHIQVINNSNIEVDLRDMNGDGLPDRIGNRLPDGTIGFLVAINNGTGFETPQIWHTPGFVGSTDYYTQVRSAYGISIDLYDMNGDGLLDRVGYELSGIGNGLIVGINNGSGFNSPERWHLSNFIGSQANHVKRINNSNIEIHLRDMNGDGILDRVGKGSNGFLVALGKEVRPSIIAINNYDGKTLDLDYTPVSQHSTALLESDSTYPDMLNRFSGHLVTSIKTSAGGSDHEITYDYHNGKMHMGLPHERKNLYFEYMTETSPSGEKVRTYYNQTAELAGTVSKVERYSSDGLLMEGE